MEPVEAAINLVVLQGEVNTDVMLGGCLPLDILIATLCTNVAVVKGIAAIAAGNVVGGTSLTASPETCGDNSLIERVAGIYYVKRR